MDDRSKILSAIFESISEESTHNCEGNKKNAGKSAKESSFLIEDSFPEEYTESSAMPNILNESSLFTICETKYLGKNIITRIVYNKNGNKIQVTGIPLNQTHQDIFMIIKKACIQQKDLTATMSTFDVLKTLGEKKYRYPSPKDRKWLSEHIETLCHAKIKITLGDEYAGLLVNIFPKLTWVENFKIFTIELSSEIKTLFRTNEFTYVHLPTRFKLKKQMSKWLHSYILTHREIMPLNLDTIHTKCGSTCKNINDFKKTIKKALTELQTHRVITTFQVKNDKIYITKSKATVKSLEYN